MDRALVRSPWSANEPAWVALDVTTTNLANFVQFDAAFTSTNPAQGLLTVYWNTNQIGLLDERFAATNLQTYRFALSGKVTNGLYTLASVWSGNRPGRDADPVRTESLRTREPARWCSLARDPSQGK